MKKIISFAIAFSMLFASSGVAVAQNQIQALSLPSNYSYLSDELKAEVLKDLISQIQERIENLIAKKNSENQAEMPLATRVVMNTLDSVSFADVREYGSFSMSMKAESSEENIEVYLDDIVYSASVKGEENIDFSISGKYSVFIEMENENPVEIKEDFFSFDVVMDQDLVYVKVDGFDEVIDRMLEGYIAAVEDGIIDEERSETLSKVVQTIKNSIQGQWIEIPLEEGYLETASTYELITGQEEIITIDSLKNIYINNQFMSFMQPCGESYVSVNSMLCEVQMDYSVMQNFIQDLVVTMVTNMGETVTSEDKEELAQVLSQVFMFLEENMTLSMKLSLTEEEMIDGEEMYMDIKINKENLEEYFGPEVSDQEDFDFEMAISSRSVTDENPIIRTITNAQDIEEIQTMLVLQVQSMYGYAKLKAFAKNFGL